MGLSAQEPCRYVNATDLTLCGKQFPSTPNPYHRVDTAVFHGFTRGENLLVREAAGLAVAFRTDSPSITLRATFGEIQYKVNVMGIAVKGFDLYIRKEGEWLWASSAAAPDGKENEPLPLIKNMDGSLHECLLYLPLFSELKSLEIGVAPEARLEAIPEPFRHRVAIFGSSFTHGASVSRSGMSYASQLTRRTGIQLLSLGCSGNCKMQPYFADVLCATEADAFIFDTFSNPTPAQIEARLFPFIEKLQAAHPGKPLIFQSSIYREKRNFSTAEERKEAARRHMSDSLMRIAVKRYRDVYYIHPSATSEAHDTTVDGVHPGDAGHTLWARSVEKPILRILRKYGIR